ncbi:MAG: PilZ domain-containing protein [Smithella sp.]|nr:PilZ domain-containing protein [Syntrophaceae bacterium]NTW76867.1 PilZ domain-containing protein [Syntrophaceae bacterium]
MTMPDLKVGTGVDIVFENEINKRNAHYMKALVYDYKGSNVIISQTSPPLSRRFLNRRVAITFLAKADKRIARFGFMAQLVGLTTDYQISADRSVEALVFKQLEKLQRMDFRVFFRVKPPSYSNINLYFRGEKVNLIDISLGGAKFSYPATHLFRRGDTVNFELIIDYTAFEVEARVCNLSLPQESSANKALQYVGVEFEGDNKRLEGVLGKAIIAIERQMLSEGKII